MTVYYNLLYFPNILVRLFMQPIRTREIFINLQAVKSTENLVVATHIHVSSYCDVL